MKVASDRYSFRAYLPGDEVDLVALFNRVFRALPTDGPPRTLDEWRRTFAESPGGFRLQVALDAGAIVAQSAGIGYRVWCDGRETRFAQSVDSLVDPGHRNGLKQPGLFVRTVERYIDAYARRPDLVFFGWPNRAAWRLGHRFLGYELVRRQELLARAPGEGPCALPGGVERVTGVDDGVRALWERCARHWGASTIRDERFVRWRFHRQPARRYELFALRGDGARSDGLCVLRLAHRPVPSALVIADWLVPEDEPAAGELLLAAVLARARACGARTVVALFPPWSAWSERFARAGFRPHDAECLLTARSHCARHDLEWLRAHWWYQLAESDWI